MQKFAKKSFVVLPGNSGAQATVVDVTETIPGFPVYTLRWLDDAGETHTGTVGEGDLLNAQPETITLCASIAALKVIIEQPKPQDRIFKSKPKPKRKR